MMVRYRYRTYIVRDTKGNGNSERDLLRNSGVAAKCARVIYANLDVDKEHFTILALDCKNRVNGFKVVSTGSLTGTLVNPREVYRAALLLNANAVVFVHNHPSGDSNPSQEDIDLTLLLKRAGDLMGVRVLDHLILSRESYYSFTDQGKLG
jgi:DNA repair protein RadC